MLLILLAAQAAPIERTAYWTCLEQRAVELERSGERARDVAVAIVDGCDVEMRAYMADRGFGLRQMSVIKDKLVDKMTAKVVEIRAGKRR